MFYAEGPTGRFEIPFFRFGTEYVRKETEFLTNSIHIWQALQGNCGNLISGDWHRHNRHPGAEPYCAAVFPPRMVAAAL